MKTQDMTRIAILAAILYIIQLLGSSFLYFEWVNFIILLYGVSLRRRESYLAVMVFCLLMMLTRGFGIWSIMYVAIFPQYALLYSLASERLKSPYSLSLLGGLLAFCCGTLIDLPYILMADLSYQGLITRLILGFQVSLSSAMITFLSSLYLLEPLKARLKKITGNSHGNS